MTLSEFTSHFTGLSRGLLARREHPDNVHMVMEVKLTNGDTVLCKDFKLKYRLIEGNTCISFAADFGSFHMED